MAEAIRARAGITDAEVDAEYGSNPKPKGLENSEYVLAIVRAIDKRFGGVSGEWIKGFMRDVFLYTKRAGVRTEVDKIVTQSLNEEPTIVVAHSLGAVVAYNVLRSDPRRLNIPLLVTVGCPLGIRPIRDEFRPLRFPAPVSVWYNAYDKRDVVALYPLDRDNFPVSPSVHNYDGVNNQTENRHGIDGYLDDPDVAKEILSAIKA